MVSTEHRGEDDAADRVAFAVSSLRAGARETGRFLFDDRLIDVAVGIANRPRLLTLLTFGAVTTAGLTYSLIEKGVSWTEGIWWAVVTGFTVGYGDFFPTSSAGRVLGSTLIVTMFVLALCLGAQITSRLIEDHDEFTHAEQEQIKALLRHLVEQQAAEAARAEAECTCPHHRSHDASPTQAVAPPPTTNEDPQ